MTTNKHQFKTVAINTIAGLLISTGVFAQKKDALGHVRFLNGTWKIENKESYETWKVLGDTILDGSAYEMKAGKKVTSEYLAIKNRAGRTIYTAKVLDQNNAVPVEFTMNKSVKNKLLFENPKHDFPKKIQYTQINPATVFVEVTGDDGKGFSYRMTRQGK